ncbi:MAG: hypothetical protein PHT11_00595 [Synergistaceae bacterium]|uniref:hypothetical protein n=1 Tax=Aminivibrio sp. TaxID=1872489 RepID=UPI00345F0E38|nr:hypothetical protein [Synergistaceae bacterium]
MKIMTALTLVISLLFSVPAVTGAEAADDSFFAKAWEKAMPKLEKSLQLFDRQKELPESSFFGEDRKSNTKKYDELLDEVFEILIGSELHNSRQEYGVLEMKIGRAGDEISQLQKERITAPEKSWNPLKKTRAKIDGKIEKLKEEITDLSARKDELKKSMKDSLQAMGVKVEERQLDILLSSVSGDDILYLLLAADSIRKINLQIVDLLRGGQGNVQSARKYTGVHMVLVDLYLQANLDVLDKIGKEYIPRLEAIMTSAKKLGDEARQMLAKSGSDEKTRQVLEVNVKANERTVKTAELYRKYLRGQENSLRDAVGRLRRDHFVAKNTYDTVKTGSDLISLIQISMSTLEGVFGFAVPDLSIVYDQELMKEFERITERIRTGS